MTPHFFYISDISKSSTLSGKSLRKKSMLKIFAQTSLITFTFYFSYGLLWENKTTPSISLFREFSTVPVFRSVPVFQCSGVLVFRCSGVPVFRCSAVPLFRCSGVPVFRCSGVPGFSTCSHFALVFKHGAHFWAVKRYSINVYFAVQGKI